ncbi:carbohydrate-binding module family 1 protein [Pleomassaria siparia CBS 279.74]|uniref:AA9 family lytic polysaccharide monooxygenase n=1 Tax=Pleomassaria siparia CBS 279.74 TaxID=1314801 RepID=A0A6G1KN39_9PLEO|nr:carbohydrate-binding module family 1 protein [Pleomassaria siparia CBS 279.74]
MRYSFTALALVAVTSAHQNFHQFWVNDVSPGYQIGVRMPPSNSPVTDVTSNDMACNVGGSTVPSTVETVAAAEGDKITVGWDTSGHPGPITHFLFGPVDSAAAASGVGAGWFKIDELDYKNGTWANAVLEAAGGNYTFTLPTGLASGEYLLRSEMLALHGAQTVGGAQFYIGCAQLKITGTGSGSCTPTISIPGAYKAEDANIYIPNVYNGFDASNYTAPGGPVAVCGGSGTAPVATSAPVAIASSTAVLAPSSVIASTAAVVAPSSVAPVVSSVPTKAANSTLPTFVVPTQVAPTTLATLVASASSNGTAPTFPTPSAPVSAPAPAPSAGTGGSVALYGQCGGANWTGATTCATGAKCEKMNDYYSQCVGSVVRRSRQYVPGL